MVSVGSCRDRLAEIRSGTHAVIDLDRYNSNLRLLSRMAGPDMRVMAVVKANAYGHGAVECGRAALAAGCAYLGVARIDEALQLRKAGITGSILVIGPPNPAQIREAIRNDIALTVSTDTSAEAVVEGATSLSARATVHVKVDTGLHRYGARPELAAQLVQRIDGHEATQLEGVYTHFSSADEEEARPTFDQIAQFEGTIAVIRERGVNPPLIHLANSAAIIEGLTSISNMVRAGIASYGLDPSDEIPAPSGVQQILSLRSVLTRRFTLMRGESVSYNRTYTAERDEPVAAVPIGYADGIERHLSNRGWFVHADGRCPIIGRVCMDQTVVRVPATAREGDPLTVIGDGADRAMSVRMVGELCGTNTYEPVTRIAARVPRLYVASGGPVSWSVPILNESGTL